MSPTLTKRIGHAQIQIRDRRRHKKSLRYDDWFGTAQLDDMTFRFVTDRDDIKEGERYHVVYEKLETPTGEVGIKIHDVIS
jgi:polyisoprenoid-binding protein YceI